MTGNTFLGVVGQLTWVLHSNECDFQQAVAWLNDRFGEGATLEAVTYKTREIIHSTPAPKFIPPVPEESKWQAVRKYLTKVRKLPSGLVDSLHQQGLIYADKKQNAVFIRRSIDESQITGASLRGTAGADNTFLGLAKGSKRSNGWFHFQQGGQPDDPVTRAVLVESAIDAMSFAVLDRTDSRKTIYISTDGAGIVPFSFLKSLPNSSVIVAYDNDEPGNLMAQKVQSMLPNSVRRLPKAKDWNEELLNMFNWESMKGINQIERQSQLERKRDGGLSW